MKVFSRIVIVLGILLVVGYFSLWAVIDLKGKDIVISLVEKKTGNQIEIDSLKFAPPLGVTVRGISSKNFQAKKIEATFSISQSLIRDLAFNTLKIKEATIEVIKKEDEINFPVVGLVPFAGIARNLPLEEKDGIQAVRVDEPAVFDFSVGRVLLEDVDIQFVDNSKDKNFSLLFKGLKGYIYNTGYPFTHRMQFDLASGLKVKEIMYKDVFSVNGWIDFSTKSMDVDLLIEQIPYNEFGVYYPSFWKPNNIGLARAIFSLDMDLVSEYNDLTISGRLTLLEHEFQVTKYNQTKVAIAKGLLGMFSQNKEHPGFNFEIKSKFDNPQIDLSKITAQFDSNLSKTDIAVTIGKEMFKGAARDTVNKSKDATKKVIDVGADTTMKAVDVTGSAVKEVLKTPERAGDIIEDTGDILKSMFSESKEDKSQITHQNNTVED